MVESPAQIADRLLWSNTASRACSSAPQMYFSCERAKKHCNDRVPALKGRMTGVRSLSRKDVILLLLPSFHGATGSNCASGLLRGFDCEGGVARQVARLHVTSTTGCPWFRGSHDFHPKSCSPELPVCVASCLPILLIYRIIPPSFRSLFDLYTVALFLSGRSWRASRIPMESTSSSMLAPGLDDLGTIDFFQHPDT